ncbi:MAG TPA: pyridoxal-phosphate dependent enzyme, partial [Chthoniobacterales bacterium]|nr:pyridoxal-phosphate dependent enzyme [Chthoniobacterales bacterium]
FYDRVIENPETVASAIRIGNPASWQTAVAALRDSDGAVDVVTDQEMLSAQRWLAAKEGIFVEPASAAPIAGLFKICDAARASRYRTDQIQDGSALVCTVTGHGLKDPDSVLQAAAAITPVPANADEVLRALSF